MSPTDPKSPKHSVKTGKPGKTKKKAKATKVQHVAGIAPQNSATKATETTSMGLTIEQRELVEKLSANLARAALTAQGAIAESALRQAERPAALTPDPFHVAPALTDILGRIASQPERLVRAQADLFQRYLELWQSAARKATGQAVTPVVEPANP